MTAALKYHDGWEYYGDEALRELANSFIELLEASSSLWPIAPPTAEAGGMIICPIISLGFVAAMHDAYSPVGIRRTPPERLR